MKKIFSYLKDSMLFVRFFQITNKELIKLIIKPLIFSQFKAIIVLLIRILSFGFYGSLRVSKEDLKININENSEKFILDLRNARLNLHLLAMLAQFFISIKNKYQSFEIWVNDNSYREGVRNIDTFHTSQLYYKEYKDLCQLFTNTLNIPFIKKNTFTKLDKKNSSLSISGTNGMLWKGKDWNLPESMNEIFCKKLELESKPMNFKLKIDYNRYPQLYSLEGLMKKTFNIAFYPTLDINRFTELSDRGLGVVSKSTFKIMDETYSYLIEEIRRRKAFKIKIFLLNKKAFDWPVNEFVYDFRNFENYGLNFSSMIYFVHKNFHWAFGSEGTMLNYLMLSDRLKHVIYVDNSHWPEVNTAEGAVPMFYKNLNYIDYTDKPKTYVPDKESVIKSIFDHYDSLGF